MWTLLGEREQPGPELGPALPFHSGCWFRRLHCSPGKHLSTISLMPSLWLDVDMHRSLAADHVSDHSHHPWDQGAAQQLWAGLGGGAEGVPLFRVAALIPGPRRTWAPTASVSVTWLAKGWREHGSLRAQRGQFAVNWAI